MLESSRSKAGNGLLFISKNRNSPTMPLAIDLLRQAEHLANLDTSRSNQANLRRAVSAAYYSLFHLLIADCTGRLSAKRPAKLAPRIARAFAHSEMKQVCRAISEGHRSAVLEDLQPAGFSPGLRLVASTFVRLQDERHRADYDVSATFTRLETLDILVLAKDGFTNWTKTRRTEETNVFLAALLFSGRWAK